MTLVLHIKVNTILIPILKFLFCFVLVYLIVFKLNLFFLISNLLCMWQHFSSKNCQVLFILCLYVCNLYHSFSLREIDDHCIASIKLYRIKNEGVNSTILKSQVVWFFFFFYKIQLSYFYIQQIGSTTYTCMLNDKGGIMADLTVSVLENGDGSNVFSPVLDGQ